MYACLVVHASNYGLKVAKGHERNACQAFLDRLVRYREATEKVFTPLGEIEDGESKVATPPPSPHGGIFLRRISWTTRYSLLVVSGWVDMLPYLQSL